MKIYIWRHNKTYHSHSMINEPCVNNEFYVDAVVIVAANSKEEALAQLEQQQSGWRIEDLRQIEPQEYSLEASKVIFTDLRGSIDHL
ncbi:MAG: hypothetical protein PHQ45_00495 [Acidaminococcaceae bacterium]|jgi:hypothetical protein|nr:hypothetical protein [Acidaminococcaceae bacterium]